MRSARRLLVRVTGPLLVLLGAATLLAADKLESQAFQTALTSITAGELGHHVDVLADDTFEGRQAGSRGGARRAVIWRTPWTTTASRQPAWMAGTFSPLATGTATCWG